MRKHYFLIIVMGLFMAGCTVIPEPLTIEDIRTRASDDLQVMFADQEPVTAPVTLYDAMARAVKYNLDHRLKLMEETLANKQLDVSRYEVLPKLAASAGYRHRDKKSGAYSESLIDGTESLVASTSEERNIATTDLSLMWNVLDLGVSYLRANQHADRLLIAEERRRKVIQNIILDVSDAYWRAVAGERLIPEMNTLLDRAKGALDRSRQIAGQRLKPPREILEYQRSLLENIRLLWGLIQRLDPAKIELGALMNLSPGTDYELARPVLKIPSLTNSVESLEHLAMLYRPELREEDYKRRITSLEARKALLRMLPGIDINFGYNYDSNKFLYHKSWWQAGARVSFNIFNLFSGPAAHSAALAQMEMDDVRRQALGMAILTQTHLAIGRYRIAMAEYLVSRDLDEVHQKLNNLTTAAASAGRADDASVIQSETNALVAKMRRNMAYAELQHAAARVAHSTGIDIMPENPESADIKSLAKAFEESFSNINERLNETVP